MATALSGISLASYVSFGTQRYVVTFVSIVYLACMSPFLWKLPGERPHFFHPFHCQLSVPRDGLSKEGYLKVCLNNGRAECHY